MEENLFNSITLLLLMIIALAAAWYLGYRNRAGNSKEVGNELSRDYFIGLNYLLNDEPDEAIDTFISALEITSNTLETHMALGTLLRRRGKVDKSIVVYQSLLARTGLDERKLNRVKVELVRSYIAAGLLDRAERLLDELRTAHPKLKESALALAVTVYQLEREWEKAVSSVIELLTICPSKERPKHQIKASHFYCELAEIERELKHYNATKQYLKKAFQYNRNSVRASLLLAKVESSLGNHKAAIKALSRVKQQDVNYLSETFIPLLECYHQIGSHKKLEKFIQLSLEERPSATVLLGISNFIQAQSSNTEALAFLLERIRQKSSLRVMSKILSLLSQEESNPNQEVFLQCKQILEEYIDAKALYQCQNCGFEAKSLHWICPGCAEWEVIKPIKGILGE